MTKEEIQAQLHIITITINIVKEGMKNLDAFDKITEIANKLWDQLLQSKSIQDLQREAFEAGRLIGGRDYPEIRCINHSKDFGSNNYYLVHRTFEDYLKSLENADIQD